MFICHNRFFLCVVVFFFMQQMAFSQIAKEDGHFMLVPRISKTISMDFKQAALMDVLKIFSKQSGMNFIASEKVAQKKINMFLDAIPMDEALDQIIKSYDLQIDNQEGSNVYYVHANTVRKDKLITKVFPLKYASVPSSKVKSNFSAGVSSTPGKTSKGLGTSSSNASQGLYAAVKAIMKKTGIIIEDVRTNSLIITDVESNFPLIEDTIAKLDVPIPAILIEVEMLDISKSTSDLMGVKWGSNIFQFTGASKNSLLPFDQSAILREGKSTLVSAKPSDSSSSTSTSPYTITTGAGNLDFTGMTALVQFLKTKIDTRSLARPRILTLNNEMAEIKVSTNEAIGVSSSSVGSSSATSTTTTAERVQTGVFLTVTPQANLLTKEILLAVNPRVIQASPGGIFATGTGSSIQYKDPEERSTESLLKVKDGETVVIGGLLRKEDSNTITKVPFLGDIPFIGGAFRHKNKQGKERELIIFLTPHILDDVNKDKLFSKDQRYYKENQNDPELNKAVDDALSHHELQRQ